MVFRRRKETIVRIEAKLTWMVAQDPDTGTYIGSCPAVNLSAFGNTMAEFQAAASEAIDLLLEDLYQDGELESFLSENGWSLRNPLPEPGRKARFDVPFSINQTGLAELIPASA